MQGYEPYPSLLLALFAGLLIGLDREKTGSAGSVGGIRTFPIIALIGACAMLLSRTLSAWPLVVGGGGLAALLVVAYQKDAASGLPGITTQASAMLTYLLGALALGEGIIDPLSRRVFVVLSLAVATTLLLSSKSLLSNLSARVTKDDVIATLKFLIVAVVILPVLPDQEHGPYGVLNPFRIGLMIALIAGIGFVGYIAMRALGQGRGLLLTGAIGGLVSSTAVTMAAAARARAHPALARASALAVIIASTIMFARVLVEVFVVERPLFAALIVPLGAMAAVGLSFCAFEYLRGREELGESGSVELTNPFELGAALKMGLLYVVILVVTRWASVTFGDRGSYVAGALAGLTDVDAITLTMANLAKTGAVDPHVASRTIVLAAVANTMVKGTLSLVLGGKALGLKVFRAFGVMLVVGGVLVALGR